MIHLKVSLFKPVNGCMSFKPRAYFAEDSEAHILLLFFAANLSISAQVQISREILVTFFIFTA